MLSISHIYMGIGDWGLGIGDWSQSPIPNPQSPIPIFDKIKFVIILKFKFIKHFIFDYI